MNVTSTHSVQTKVQGNKGAAKLQVSLVYRQGLLPQSRRAQAYKNKSPKVVSLIIFQQCLTFCQTVTTFRCLIAQAQQKRSGHSWQIALFSPLVGHSDTKAHLSYTTNYRFSMKMKNGTSRTSLTLVDFTTVSDRSSYCILPVLDVRAWLKLMKKNFTWWIQ